MSDLSRAPNPRPPPDSETTGGTPFAQRPWLGWVFFGAFIGFLALKRLLAGEIPEDLSAYLAAAELFIAGRNPYGPDLFSAANFGGYVYIYPPGSRFLVQWLALFPPALVVLADALLHAGALVAALAWLRQRFAITLPLGWLAAGVAGLYAPATQDLLVGNIATYMLAAFVGAMALAHHPAPGRQHLFIMPIFGFLLAFKPMWGIPAGLILLARRQWAPALALLCGALGMAALSAIPQGDTVLIADWLARIQAVRAQYQSVDMLALWPPGLWGVIGLWLLGGALLLQRLGARHPHLWLWGAASLFAWPRLADYSYVLALALFGYFWQRWGWQRTLIIMLPGLGGVHLLRPFVPDGQAEYLYQALLYGWAWALAALTIVALWLADEPAHAHTLSAPPPA